jgi:hypothetical protein
MLQRPCGAQSPRTSSRATEVLFPTVQCVLRWIVGTVARVDDADTAAVRWRYYHGTVVQGGDAKDTGDRRGPVCHLRSATCHNNQMQAPVWRLQILWVRRAQWGISNGTGFDKVQRLSCFVHGRPCLDSCTLPIR